ILLLVLIFLFVVYRGIKIAIHASDRFSSYVACGISAVIAVQTLLNVAVVCGAIPPTGLPLPFISAGGSSLVAYLGAIGLLLSISRRQVKFISVDSFCNDNQFEKQNHFKKRKYGTRNI
ncbi:MAG: FtsW/RodA/SpoVE family cell cycle protein, partial [Clostridia bacterium]